MKTGLILLLYFNVYLEHYCLCNITLEYHHALRKRPDVAEPHLARFLNWCGEPYTRRLLQWPWAIEEYTAGSQKRLQQRTRLKGGGEGSMEKDGTKREFEMRKLQYGGTSYTVTLLYCHSDPVKIQNESH